MPRYHGHVQVEVLGEEVDGTVQPPRFRPLPNSPVFVLSEDETRLMLGLESDINLGRAVGFEDMAVRSPAKRKSVLPRHVPEYSVQRVAANQPRCQVWSLSSKEQALRPY